MVHTRCSLLLLVAAIGALLGTRAQAEEPDHVRGQIAAIQGSLLEIRGRDGKNQRLRLTNATTILSLSPASFIDVDFGVYVGAVSEKMDDRYSPILRDSLSWLHKGLEFRIIDEKLRGIALGHQKWDLTPVSVMTHGWVDDMEVRVLSIKFGPTEAEETDVEVGRDIKVLKMELADKSLVKPGAHIFAGANKGADGIYAALFLMVGVGGVVPGL
jgi:hypothetical protein